MAELERLLESRARFLAFLERRVGSRAVAEELLQGAFVKGLEKGEAIRDEERVTAWFYRVLRNAIADHHRRAGAEARAVERHARELDPAIGDPELADAVCACVGELLPTLKPEYAQILRQVDLEEQDVPSVARAAGITPNNAGVRLHRARKALRARVEEACGACATHGCVDCTCGGV